MFRLFATAAIVCFAAAAYLALLPDPWDKADQKASTDAALLADLMTQPDRITLRLSEDLSLKRAMIWDDNGDRQYPPPDGLVPLPFEFSEDAIRNVTAKQQATESTDWSGFDLAGRGLLHCRATPALCLLYDRAVLEETLNLRPGDLASPGQWRFGLALLMLGVLMSAASVWARLRSAGSDAIAPGTEGANPKLEIIAERYIAKRGTLEITLTPRDLRLLSILEQRDGAVVTKDELYDAGWGRDYMPNSRALDQHMINLRRKLDPDRSMPAVIETVRGVGYRMVT